ncbi:MAG: DUF3160 domain-containing protein [Candidatus Brocadiia bacterium]
MTTGRRMISLLLALALMGTLAANAGGEEPAAKIGKGFASLYTPVTYTVNPCVKGYSLPLAEGSVAACKALEIMGIAPNDPGLLARGFALADRPDSDDIATYYAMLTNSRIPVLLTADAALHMQHCLFMETLAKLEQDVLKSSLADVIREIKARAEEHLGDKSSAMQKNAREMIVSYCAVVLALLEGSTRTKIDAADKEILLIENHSGSAPSPIFGYSEDYSQYIPRGHYTASESLEHYFKAMMWVGRMTFLAKGPFVDLETAKVQSTAALMLSGYLENVRAKYDAIYSATAFFAGFSDDLRPDSYAAIARKLFGINPPDLTSPERYARFLWEIAQQIPPDVYSGTGAVVLPPSSLEVPKPEVLDKILSDTTGLRLMGQRFTIDGYWHGRLTSPSVGKFNGTTPPFANAPSRTMVTSLDVMALLGSDVAKAILKEQQMDAYDGYAAMETKLAGQLGKLSKENWHSTMYMSLLDAARSLFAHSGEGWQPFQRTDAWERRQLNAALGSWTALRHDTILYTKQGYGVMGTGGFPEKPVPCVGYIEPEPELFARMLALNRQLHAGLVRIAPDFKDSILKIEKFSAFLNFCLSVSISELEGKQPTPSEQQWLKSLHLAIREIIGEINDDYVTTLVADVFTDTGGSEVLEVATGPMRSMVIVWSRPDGNLEVAVGPIYSWEEFKQPMNNRLSDEAWREMLKKGPRPAPVWMRPFFAGK